MPDTVTHQFGPNYKKVAIGKIMHVAQEQPLKLDCGKEISDFPLAYQSYGTLNKDKTNSKHL